MQVKGTKESSITLTEIRVFLPRKMSKLCIFSTFINPMKLQHKWTSSDNTCVLQTKSIPMFKDMDIHES